MKNKIAVLVAILTILVIACLMLFGLSACKIVEGNATEQNLPATNNAPFVEKNPHTIAIPGYEAIMLEADVVKQSLAFPNPAQNMCYFEISLYLEDGTLLWTSSLIEPGKSSEPMILTQPLEKGTYTHAVLKYQCFKMDGSFAPLNGAESKVTLRVK